ncbi:Transposon Ty3-I Gag-Pol poly [Brachionus plicatilis]|uniref:Transposon Ty3-I Gag-Pol poly n=1 Tax=Brachionus plicatilis TaxID=10195 RepID=A0A3M7PRL4_BRAPC|nr:Transposon Ty3-I Gag-Pol poly [Brachionus plicatilis]
MLWLKHMLEVAKNLILSKQFPCSIPKYWSKKSKLSKIPKINNELELFFKNFNFQIGKFLKNHRLSSPLKGNWYYKQNHFTILMLLCPTKDAKAITAAGNVVDEWTCEYGIPEAVLSDGAKCFQSKLSDLVYDFLYIRRLKIAPFPPQCDGLSERGVRTFKTMIYAHIDLDQTTWDIHCKKYSFAYKTSLHSNKNQTRFEMIVGRKPRIQIDIITQTTDILEYKLVNEHGEVVVLEDVEDKIRANSTDVAGNYFNELKEKMPLSYKIAATNRNIKMEKSKIDFDRRIKIVDYNIDVSNDTIAKHNDVLELHVKENIALKRKTSRISKAPQHRSSRKQEIKSQSPTEHEKEEISTNIKRKKINN